MHIVGITADDMEQHNEVLTFTKDGKRCGQFSSYMGWIELLEEPKERASVTPFTIVPKPEAAAAPPGAAGWDGNGSPVDDTHPAAVLSFPFKPERS
jgi:hypothetical protein